MPQAKLVVPLYWLFCWSQWCHILWPSQLFTRWSSVYPLTLLRDAVLGTYPCSNPLETWLQTISTKHVEPNISQKEIVSVLYKVNILHYGIQRNEYCISPPLCTVVRLNWANQPIVGTWTIRNDRRRKHRPGFEHTTQRSATQLLTSGLRQPAFYVMGFRIYYAN
jgi:hypothetical protein